MSDAAERLLANANFSWRAGMLDRQGRRIVDLDLHDGTSPPDLTDWATAGCVLGMLADSGMLSDVVLEDGECIVAVHDGDEGLQGYASDSVGEAAAWALLATWGEDVTG